MLFVMLAFALVQEPAKPQPTPEQRHAAILKYLDTLDANLATTRRILETGTVQDLLKPEAGILVDSAEEPGPDGLHALTVVSLYAHSPAGDKDIRLGDRLLR